MICEFVNCCVVGSAGGKLYGLAGSCFFFFWYQSSGLLQKPLKVVFERQSPLLLHFLEMADAARSRSPLPLQASNTGNSNVLTSHQMSTTFGPSHQMTPLVFDMEDEVYPCFGPEYGYVEFETAYREVQQHFRDLDVQTYLHTRLTKSRGKHILHSPTPSWFRCLDQQVQHMQCKNSPYA